MGWEWRMIEEEKALRALRKMVEVTSMRLKEPGIEEAEAENLMKYTREWVVKVFPDRLQAYDSIYKTKFEHIYYGYKAKYQGR